MDTLSKLIDLELFFVIEQIDDNTFVCDSLSDRTILIKKNNNKYTYTTTFNISGFTFDYTVDNTKVNTRLLFSPLEKIQHDLTSCFFNYVSEDYPKKAFDGITDQKSIGFGFNRVDDLSFFHVYGYWLTKTGTINIRECYVYDSSHDEIYVDVYRPNTFKDILEMTTFSDSYFNFYQSMSTDGFIIDIAHLIYATEKDIILRYRNDTLSIAHKDQTIITFSGKNVVHNELKSLIEKIISNHPHHLLKYSLDRLEMDIETLTIEDLQLIKMVEI